MSRSSKYVAGLAAAQHCAACSPGLLLRSPLQELKLRFYSLMVQFHVHDNDTYALFEDYYAMFNTPSAQANPEKWHDALSHAVLFLVLSEHNNEQSDMLHRLQQTHRKKLEALPAFECVWLCQPCCCPPCLRCPRAQDRGETVHRPGDCALAAA